VQREWTHPVRKDPYRIVSILRMCVEANRLRVTVFISVPHNFLLRQTTYNAPDCANPSVKL